LNELTNYQQKFSDCSKNWKLNATAARQKLHGGVIGQSTID